ncbi:MAG: hypothetical protein NWQ28_09185, partial [Nodularia sp. (in: cyanobacteria)]|nr:hypothetical protein [Nodularia sp. (in: cyanobacteria)]
VMVTPHGKEKRLSQFLGAGERVDCVGETVMDSEYKLCPEQTNTYHDLSAFIGVSQRLTILIQIFLQPSGE